MKTTLRYHKGNTIVRFGSYKAIIYNNTSFVTPRDIQELSFEDLRFKIITNPNIEVAEKLC